MATQRKLFIAHASELAHKLLRSVRPHGLVADFAKSYARQHGRAGVVDEPGHIRELEITLGREAVLVMVAEVQRLLPGVLGARKGRPLDPEQLEFARMFWPEFTMALGRALEWPPEESVAEREAFDRDLLMYRRWTEGTQFSGALLHAQTSPFYDRCALLLDPSTMETARTAAAQFEQKLRSTASSIVGHLGRTADLKTPNRRRIRPARKPPAKSAGRVTKKPRRARTNKQRKSR